LQGDLALKLAYNLFYAVENVNEVSLNLVLARLNLFEASQKKQKYFMGKTGKNSHEISSQKILKLFW
jgi:hypothetical protein